jgi:Pro-kumamolisin, activation domain
MNKNKVLLAVAFFSFVAVFSIVTRRSPAQSTYSQPRINAAVSDTQLTVLRGNTHPLAQPQYDRGPAPASLPLPHMLLVLKRSPAQEAALESFMAEQLDRSSPNYHHWLTPAEFGQMYGPAQQDIDVVTKWLGSHGFQVNNVAAGRTTIDFSGTAGQVQSAFHTAIHQYVVKGEQHWANSSDPSIPTALTPVVAGVRSLHNFFPKPQTRLHRAMLHPNFTIDNGSPCDIANSSDDCFAVGPYDFATIYGVQTLWNNGIDGTGQTIAIVADSDIENISPNDVAQFRSLFGLPANPGGAPMPNVIHPDGAVGVNGDETEALLDAEWAGGVAKNAVIDLVTSPSSNTTFGGDTSANYVINCQVAGPAECTVGAVPAKILSESFGSCELALGTTGNAMYNTMWQQAASEGITVIVSSGDSGSAGCDTFVEGGALLQPASNGLAVSGVASTPYNVAVGGTDFNDLGIQTQYWSTANQANGSSALKYIPEDVWNDTCTNPIVFPLVTVSPAITTALESCNNSTIQQAGLVEVTGSGGGESNCTTYSGTNPADCTGGNTQPTWQNGLAGVMGNTRNVPDVSLFAGDGLAGSFYILCEEDTSASSGGQGGEACALGTTPNFVAVGGTSASTQAFAGIMALVDQQNGDAGNGNAGKILYELAASQSPASCNSSNGPSSTCIFNDITYGTNAQPCSPGTVDCTSSSIVPNLPADHEPLVAVRTIRIVCALGIGLLLLFGLRRRRQRWVTAAAMCGTAVLLVVSVGCGGGSSSATNPGGSQQGTPEGVMTSFSAGTGYDLATGLGTVNANNLATLWNTAGVPPVNPPATINRPALTAPVVTLAIASALCLGLLFLGLRRRQIRWTTAVLLVAFALSILSAARSSASTQVGKRVMQHPVATGLASLAGR